MLSIFTHQYRVMNSKVKLLNIKNKNKPEMEVWALGNWKQEARRSEAGGLRNQESWNTNQNQPWKEKSKVPQKRKESEWRFPLGPILSVSHSSFTKSHWALNRFPALRLASTKWTHIYVWLQESTQSFRIWLKSHIDSTVYIPPSFCFSSF